MNEGKLKKRLKPYQRHRTLTEEEFECLEFYYFGTLISGKNQEIDIFRSTSGPGIISEPDVEIRVTLNLKSGAMHYSLIDLYSETGAPIVMVSPKGRAMNDEDYELYLWEAIVEDKRSQDYMYGRVPLGKKARPGDLILPAETTTLIPEI